MPYPSRSVSTFALPEAHKDDFVGAKTPGRFEHPEIVALVGIFTRRQRASFVRHDMERCLRLHREKAIAPILIGKIDGLRKKGDLVEWDIEFECHAAGNAGFGENEVPSARSAANPEIARTGIKFYQCFRNGLRSY